jgi:hypothetical protein
MTRLALVLTIASMGCHRHEARGVEVVLSVMSSPPTEVVVIPWAGARPPRSVRTLGRTPIEGAKGVFVGDTVRLTNPTLGISYEETIEYGQPGQLRLISKTFRPSRDAGVVVKVDGGTDAGP